MERNTLNLHGISPTHRADVKPPSLPYYLRPDRKKTEHAHAARLAARGWSWGSRKFRDREAWEGHVLGYHGAFEL